jgi:carboxyl-terminal processing protease
MTLKTRLSVLLISTPVLAFVIVGGLIGDASARSGGEPYQQLRVFEDVVGLVMNNYVEPVKIDRAMEGAMRGLAEGLDPDSAYLNVKEFHELEMGTPLPEGEVGVELTRQYYLRVIAARDGSPAAKAGLQTGDYVRGIDGKATRDLSVFEGTRLLRGAPGSKVTLTIIRGNAADPHEVVLVREKATGPQVSGRMLSENTGYVRIASFRNGVDADVRRQVAALAKSGATSLIVDVRRTAEGPLENGIAAARLFVKSGTLATKIGRQPTSESASASGRARSMTGREIVPAPKPDETAKGDSEPVTGGEVFAARAGDGEFTLPVQVLVSNGTSGPAELFAAALHGNNRAELVGERTLGRVGVQKLVKLPENRGLWLTYAKYLAPGGQAIQGKGLLPEIAVDEPDVEFGAPAPDRDPVLEAAVARVKR